MSSGAPIQEIQDVAAGPAPSLRARIVGGRSSYGARARARRWDGKDAAVDYSLGIELLSRTEMRLYFPGSQIRTERAAGLPKSLIAVKTG